MGISEVKGGLRIALRIGICMRMRMVQGEVRIIIRPRSTEVLGINFMVLLGMPLEVKFLIVVAVEVGLC